MKRTLLLLLLLPMAFLAQAEVIQHTYYFARPELASAGGYMEISFTDCTLLGEEGAPLIPWYGANLLVPPGQEASEVVIISSSIADELAGITIKPASRQFPISQPVDNYLVQPDQSIYTSVSAYPAEVYRGEATHFLAGHGIVSLLISPVRYYPAEARVELLAEITIQVTTVPTQRAQAATAFLKDSEEISSRINSLVDNPGFSSVYTYPQQTREMEYDLLLISNTALLPEFADYILFKESTGYSILTAAIEDIYSVYPGVDNAEKVRNCIIDNYLNYNIGYVILGGDTDGQNQNNAIVPHRGFAVLDDPSLPSDMYFSNLDGSWNTDNDNSWGEANEMDLYSEVLIGRICVDSAEEIQNFTHKLMMYQNAPVVDDIETAAMVGEELNNNPWTWGGDYKDQIAYGSNANGYTTTGVADNFDLYFYYERDGYWDKYDIFDQFNQTGLNLLNHLGHSNPTYNMKMNNNDLTTTNFTNDGVNRGYAIGYSQGCYNGSFDNWHFSGYYTEDCFAEKFTTIATGEVASIANSRYGWYMPGGTNSSSQYYDRQFYHAIFGSNITMIGDANRAARETNASLMQNDNYMRWTAYELNLFGDPTMDIWTEIPTDMFTSYPASIPIGTDQVQLVTDAPYARVALMQGDVLIGRGISDGTGLVSINTFAPVTDVIPIELSIIAHNKNRYQGTIYVVADQPYVIYQEHTIVDAAGNGNGLADYNECFSLDMSFNNVGNQPAADVTAVLSTDDEYVEITVDSADLGDFPAETVLDFSNVFQLQAANFIPDQHRVLLDLELTGDGEDSWTSHFFITLQAPVLSVGNMYIDDSEGDGDSFLDPGETALVSIPVFNQGHALSPQAVATLTCSNSLISIQPVIDQITGLEPEDDFSLFFLITIDPETLVGTPVILDFSLNCTGYEGYNVNESYIQTIGLILDSFETGNFTSFNWQSGGDAVWTIVDNQAYDGIYSARSGNIGSWESSHLSLELDILVSSEIRFWKMVSSEAGYDFFTFAIDGNELGSWSGQVDWSEEVYTLSSGHHTLEWVYSKDGYVDGGSDCAWIDYVIMPVISGLAPAVAELSAAEISFTLSPGETDIQGLEITNAGEADLHYRIVRDYVDELSYGGPDAMGYQWFDSNEINGPVFDWVDISGLGTMVSFSHNDWACEPIALEFSFPFYGIEYDQFIINPNGWIGFGEDNQYWQNTGIPAPTAPKPAILAFWDDLRPWDGTNGGGNVYYYSTPESLVVWFDNVIHYPGDYNGTYDFQTIIYPNGEILLQYNELEGDLESCTVGIQNEIGNIGLPVVYNSSYLTSQLAVRFKQVDNWLELSDYEGVIIAGNTDIISLTAEAGDLEEGNYYCNLLILSNDGTQQVITIPVTLTVQQTGAEDDLPPLHTELLGNFPNPFNPVTQIRFSLAADAAADLAIFNLKGQKVRSYHIEPSPQAAYHTITWEGSDEQGKPVSSGVYFYKLNSGQHQSTRKMIMLK